MARKGLVLLISLLVLCTLVSSIKGRKLPTNEHHLNKAPSPPSVDDMRSLYLTELPKGKVPASTPSKKGHATIVDQKLIARHLSALDRILRSVPSPGVGH